MEVHYINKNLTNVRISCGYYMVLKCVFNNWFDAICYNVYKKEFKAWIKNKLPPQKKQNNNNNKTKTKQQKQNKNNNNNNNNNNKQTPS